MATGRPRNTIQSGTIPVIDSTASTHAQSKITQNSQNLASMQGGLSSGGRKAVGQSAPQAVGTFVPSHRQVSPVFAQPTASSLSHSLPTPTASRGEVGTGYASAPFSALVAVAYGSTRKEGPVDLEGTGSSFEPSSVTDPLDLTETSLFDGPLSGLDGGEGSIEEGTSITAALRAAQKGKDKGMIDLYLEDLPQAVERYHILFDPTSSTQEDPLILFGVHHGEVAGKDMAATELLRDAVIHYQHRNIDFSWDSLSQLIQQVAAVEAETVHILPTRDPVTQERFCSLTLARLADVAHAIDSSWKTTEMVTRM
ncbi:hypothetical protein B0H19DRAFT_1065188 [Mycena capillaripes]|nr:hypothetical protein B0H19DRAFT_1065188 [Mycena capillaripes]